MPTETLEAELAAALRRRLAVIGDRALRESDPERHLADLREASERIVALRAQLPANTHPQLVHYFDRCSYDKALAWIEHDGLTGSGK
jgi:hypothetical protein